MSFIRRIFTKVCIFEIPDLLIQSFCAEEKRGLWNDFVHSSQWNTETSTEALWDSSTGTSVDSAVYPLRARCMGGLCQCMVLWLATGHENNSKSWGGEGSESSSRSFWSERVRLPASHSALRNPPYRVLFIRRIVQIWYQKKADAEGEIVSVYKPAERCWIHARKNGASYDQRKAEQSRRN